MPWHTASSESAITKDSQPQGHCTSNLACKHARLMSLNYMSLCRARRLTSRQLRSPRPARSPRSVRQNWSPLQDVESGAYPAWTHWLGCELRLGRPVSPCQLLDELCRWHRLLLKECGGRRSEPPRLAHGNVSFDGIDNPATTRIP